MMHFMHMNGQTVSGSILEPGGLPLQFILCVSDINPIVPYVYAALERAIADGTAFFPQGDSVDPFLFPNLVRYYAHRYLKGAPEEIDGFYIERLSNNGIFFAFGAYRIRVWKKQTKDNYQHRVIRIEGLSFSSSLNSFRGCD